MNRYRLRTALRRARERVGDLAFAARVAVMTVVSFVSELLHGEEK